MNSKPYFRFMSDLLSTSGIAKKVPIFAMFFILLNLNKFEKYQKYPFFG